MCLCVCVRVLFSEEARHVYKYHFNTHTHTQSHADSRHTHTPIMTNTHIQRHFLQTESEKSRMQYKAQKSVIILSTQRNRFVSEINLSLHFGIPILLYESFILVAFHHHRDRDRDCTLKCDCYILSLLSSSTTNHYHRQFQIYSHVFSAYRFLVEPLDI